MSRPVGPYTPVVRAGAWLVTSGQLGVASLPDGTSVLVEGGTEAELRQALHNLAGLLESEGSGLGAVTKATLYLTDMGDFARVNTVWTEVFGDHRPARSAVGVQALPMGARVEVDAWAYAPATSEGRPAH
jgi:2-iminobutanoate/2-iminopropanoate deaminase